MMMDSYSVVMSVYEKDNPKWLSEAVDSMLAQTVPPSEMVIVKDGALPTELESVLSDYCDGYPGIFKFVSYPENQGLGYALQRGVSACQYPVIARMDADDISIPNRMELQLGAMKRDDLDMVGSQVIEFDSNTGTSVALTELPEKHQEIVEYSKRRNPFRHPSITFKKESVLAAGNYNPEFLYFEDWDLFNRMLSIGCKSANLQNPLVYMRVNNGFYARRGGRQYLKYAYRFKRAQVKRGWFTWMDFVLSFIPQAAISLLPNSIRTYVYVTLLRKPLAPQKG